MHNRIKAKAGSKSSFSRAASAFRQRNSGPTANAIINSKPMGTVARLK